MLQSSELNSISIGIVDSMKPPPSPRRSTSPHHVHGHLINPEEEKLDLKFGMSDGEKVKTTSIIHTLFLVVPYVQVSLKYARLE